MPKALTIWGLIFPCLNINVVYFQRKHAVGTFFYLLLTQRDNDLLGTYGMGVHTTTCGNQKRTKCSTPSLSNLFLWDRVSHQAMVADRKSQLSSCLHFPPHSTAFTDAHVGMPFRRALGIWTQVLRLVHQENVPTECLPSLTLTLIVMPSAFFNFWCG